MAEKESGLDQFPDAMPRPWTAEVGERLCGDGDCWVIDCEIGSVAEMQCGIDREGQTAKLIVAAVNAYDSRRSDAEQLSELRKAGARMLEVLETYKERHLVPSYFVNALADLRDMLGGIDRIATVQCADCLAWFDKNSNHTCAKQVKANRRRM